MKRVCPALKGNFLQNYSFLSSTIIKGNFFAYTFDNLCICKYNKTTVVWTFTENDWFGEFEKQKEIKTSASKRSACITNGLCYFYLGKYH